MFLESEEKVLQRRFSETRRPHPLAINQPAIEGIREEKEALRPIRKMADLILDTSDYTVHQLRDYIREHYDVRAEAAPMVLSVMSFGYKYGVPSEADLVFDARFLPNPNFVPALKPLTGNNAPVIRYMKRQKETRPVPEEARGLPRLRRPAVRQGREELPDHRRRLHGRPPPLGDDHQRRSPTALSEKGYTVKVRHRDLKQA